MACKFMIGPLHASAFAHVWKRCERDGVGAGISFSPLFLQQLPARSRMGPMTCSATSSPLVPWHLPVASVYVDNTTAIGGAAADTSFCLDGFQGACAAAGFPTPADPPATFDLEPIGIRLFGGQRPEVIHKYDSFLTDLFRYPAVAALHTVRHDYFEIWVGHACLHARLLLAFLVDLPVIYRELCSGGRRVILSDAVKSELRGPANGHSGKYSDDLT